MRRETDLYQIMEKKKGAKSIVNPVTVICGSVDTAVVIVFQFIHLNGLGFKTTIETLPFTYSLYHSDVTRCILIPS